MPTFRFNFFKLNIGLWLGTILFFAVLFLPVFPSNDIQRMTAIAVLMVTLWISEALPLAATANTEMGAKGSNSFTGIGMELQGDSFCPVFFIFQQAYIYYITLHHILYKDHFAVYPGQAFAFSSVVLHQDFLQYYVFLFFSHAANIP